MSFSKFLLASVLTIASFSSFANESLYNKLDLNNKISYKVFEKAYNLYQKDNSKNKKDIFTVIDYSKPSTVKRFAIINIKKEKVLLNTYVSHGANSGSLLAKKFSNKLNSHQTSLGIFKTAETYFGKHGYSLRLDGLSKTNNKARIRSIVVHGAKYAETAFISKHKYLGRSWGCPAVPQSVSKQVINLIKNGTMIYSFA